MPGKPLASDASRGFPPVAGPKPRVLVLGSLPGRASIEAGQYYAQPRNAFWQIMGQLCAAGPELSYRARLAALSRAGIALWDVLHAAERPGSLDSSIVAATQQLNDIPGLLESRTTIGAIFFNGRKAAEIFRRHVEPRLPRQDIVLATLPSTSPAFASLRPERKAELWVAALLPWLDPV